MVHKFKKGDKVKIKAKSDFVRWFKNGTNNLEIADFLGPSYFVWENDKSTTWAVPEEELEREQTVKSKTILELSNGELLMFDTLVGANDYLYKNPQSAKMYNAKEFREAKPTVRFENLK